ncbi:MAG: site-specific DNA-methyltransferase [Anaerolineae bacterium]|nr:site-specific DNA-methyltransferase [Anaerolineae bacterium]
MTFLNQIILGSAERMDVIPKDVIDLTVTSPPYWNAIDYNSHASNPHQNYRTRKTESTYSEYLDFLKRCFAEVYRVHRPGSFVAVVIGTILQNGTHIPLPHHFVRVMEEIGFEFDEEILWHKCTAGIRRAGTFIQHPFPGYYHPNIMTEHILIFRKPGEPIFRKRSAREKEQNRLPIDSLFTHDIANNLWNIAPVPPGVVDHPCPFPEEIPDRLIKLFSYRGDIVLDPFAGSGTTLKVAKHLGRHFVGYEIEPKYVALAQKRLEERSGIRSNQLILEFKKITLGEHVTAKNPKQRRYRKATSLLESSDLPLFSQKGTSR